jgi:hypothetical protein
VKDIMPMHSLATSIELPCTPQAVWDVLTDLGSYHRWNPFVIEASGRAELGAPMAITVDHPSGNGQKLKFRPVVTRCEPPRAFAWTGTTLSAAVFKGEHWFRIEPLDQGCRLHHGESFSGLAATVLGARGVAAMRPGYEAMNRALAAEVARRIGL